MAKGGMHGGRHAWWEAFVAGGTYVAGGGVACVAGETATAADGRHPTGMHFCSSLFWLLNKVNKMSLSE